MKIILIAAHDPDLVIGKDGDLPWHYPEDLKFFKRTTMGHPLLMGRIVFESFNEKPLPGREAVVLSRSKTYSHVPAFKSIDGALDYLSDHDNVFVAGGGQLYKQTLGIADQLIITEIHKKYGGDTYFPEYRDDIGTVWEEVSRKNREEFSFVKYERL
ncbi:dihydrofolate reductase [soil metagenome]